MVSSASFRTKAKINNSYLQLVMEFPLISIESDGHLNAASGVIDKLLAKEKLDEGEELYLDALSELVATYEDKHHPISSPSDSDMLRHLLEMRGISQAELSRSTGLAKSSLSEVLSGKKAFSRQMIRALAEYFQIDASVLASNF